MNAGVLLFNLAEVRKTGLFKKAREMCNNKKMAFPDQTALNKLNKKKYFLPRCYNEQYKLRKDTVIQHFSKSIRFFPFYHTVNIKPWQVDKIHDVYHLNAYDGVLYEYLAHVANLRLKGIY
jgi:lipopolysaccharide biosynthesis glycosyltransferase